MLSSRIGHVAICKLTLDNNFVKVKLSQDFVMHMIITQVFLVKIIKNLTLFFRHSEVILLRLIFGALVAVNGGKKIIRARCARNSHIIVSTLLKSLMINGARLYRKLRVRFFSLSLVSVIIVEIFQELLYSLFVTLFVVLTDTRV